MMTYTVYVATVLNRTDLEHLKLELSPKIISYNTKTPLLKYVYSFTMHTASNTHQKRCFFTKTQLKKYSILHTLLLTTVWKVHL